MIKVVSVKFKGGEKPYYFSPCKQELSKGTDVIVETAKGLEYATVVEPEREVEDDAVVLPLMPVVRAATQKDREQVKRNEERRGEAMAIAREKIAARGLNMKPVACEFSFDCSKVIIYFTAETRVDFRELIKDLSAAFRMRIELRQIGIREEIKLMGGLAPCGRECCCVKSLQEPKKVAVKMAKNQGLSLNPTKISGLCGRLMCCLSYENDYYAEAYKKVPKLGAEADTLDGKGTVVNVNMLKMQVKVKIENGEEVSYRDYPVDKIAFRRGNEQIGKVGGEDDPAEEVEVEPEGESDDFIFEREAPARPAETAKRAERQNRPNRAGKGAKNAGEQKPRPDKERQAKPQQARKEQQPKKDKGAPQKSEGGNAVRAAKRNKKKRPTGANKPKTDA